MSLRIGHIVLHSCIRAYKIGWTQLLEGKIVHLFTERIRGNHPWKDFQATHVIHTGEYNCYEVDKQHLGTTIQTLDPLIDIWHYHNEPDWPISVVRQATDKPIIWDCHDMKSIREGKPNEDEEKALEVCNAISVPSRFYKENIEARTKKPVEEILSCVPECLFPKVRRSVFLPGIVYEGGLRGAQAASEQFHYRSWAESFNRLVELGVPVWAYHNHSGENLSNFKSTMIMGPLDYPDLLKNLTAHECAIVGSPYETPAFNGSLPNKLFEYIAAGLPVIALNSKTSEEFLLATGMGVGVKTIEEIPEALERIRKENLSPDPDKFESLRDYIWVRGRLPWTMERQMAKLNGLYEKCLA